MKSGNLNFLEPSGPLQACNRTALPLPLHTLCNDCAIISFERNHPFKSDINFFQRLYRQGQVTSRHTQSLCHVSTPTDLLTSFHSLFPLLLAQLFRSKAIQSGTYFKQSCTHLMFQIVSLFALEKHVKLSVKENKIISGTRTSSKLSHLSLTPWNTIMLEKLLVDHLAKKFPR